MQSGRTFSFDDNDEVSLSTSQQQPLNYHLQSQSQSSRQPYHDHHNRDVISPPPQYSSPAPYEPSPQNHPRSSVLRSQEADYQGQSQGGISREVSRRPIASSYGNIPPPPPPHSRNPNTTLNDLPSAQRYRSNESSSSHGPTESRRNRGTDQNSRDTSLDSARSRPMAAPAMSYLPGDRDHSPMNNYPYSSRPDSRLVDRSSYASNLPLAVDAATPGTVTPRGSEYRSSRHSGYSIPLDDYPSNQHMPISYPSNSDSPYFHSGPMYNSTITQANIDPHNIADDGDDGFIPDPKRRSVLPGGRNHDQKRDSGKMAAATVAGTGMLDGIFPRPPKNQSSSGSYGPVATGQDGSGVRGEKTGWLNRQKQGSRKMRWVVGFVIGAVVVLAVIGGIVGGVLGSKGGSSSSSGSGPPAGSINNADTDLRINGDLSKDSSEIKALLNNKNLHKVFPGMDYTPWGVQYPLCEKYPPSQNNVTRDMAVLSQLTNTVRLYGTDCNQTEMVLHSIDRLGLKSMKLWLGVWIDTNTTTNNRQMDKLYNILSTYTDHSIFKGVIIGNEALFRAGEDKATSQTELIALLTQTRTKFKSLGYNLPIATSDLGDNWTIQLASAVDYVMANIHPFFAGVQADTAAAWTMNFWQTRDVVLTQNLPNVKHIISETGWPSEGGKNCGGAADCAVGAVASVANMNTFMNSWVCQALKNGTDYFWFEAFDEPWKITYNTPGKEWEDKWGLMDSARNLKSGIKIPDCGGKTVS